MKKKIKKYRKYSNEKTIYLNKVPRGFLLFPVNKGSLKALMKVTRSMEIDVYNQFSCYKTSAHLIID